MTRATWLPMMARALRTAAAQLAVACRPDWICCALSAMLLAAALVASSVPATRLISRVSASAPGQLQIYYSGDGRFSELHSRVVPLAGGTQSVSVDIPAGQSAILRVDPPAAAQRTTFCDLNVRLPDGALERVDPRRFSAANAVDVSVERGCATLMAESPALEAQAMLDLSSLRNRTYEARDHRRRIGLLLGVLAIALAGAAVAVRRWAGRAYSFSGEWQALGKRLPWIYLWAALFMGGLYCITTPPGGVPDEPAHMAKTTMVENGKWKGSPEAGSLDPGMLAVLGPFDDFLNPHKRFTVAQVFDHAEKPLHCRPTKAVYPASAENYSPTMYVPGALVLNAACSFQAPTGLFVYGGRFANLVLAVLLVFAGLRAAGGHAWPLFAIAMLPMVLFEQASFSADSPILALTLCIAGVQIGLATGQLRPGWKVETALFALGLALALTKPGYAWICIGFAFCMTSYRREARSFWPRAALLIAVPWLVHVAWVLSSAASAVPRPGVDPAMNMAAFTNDPGDTLRLWWRTFFGEGSAFLWTSMVGRLGWLDVLLHPGTYVLAWTALVASLGLRNPEVGPVPDARLVRPAAVLLAAGAVLLPAFPMYLFWTPAGALMIEGLQGRYLIPSAAFCLAWLSFRAPGALRAPAALFVLLVAIAANLDALYNLAERYYG